MDFAMREWLTVIIILLIVGVLLDGWRRMRQARYGSIKMSSNVHKSNGNDPLDGYGSELPNGGARVIGKRDHTEAAELTRNLRKEYSDARTTKSFKSRIPEQVSLNLDEEVPMLMDPVADAAESERYEPTFGDAMSDGIVDDLDDTESFVNEADDELYEPVAEVPQTRPEPPRSAVADRSTQPAATRSAPKAAAARPSATEEPERREPDEVIIFNVMSREGYRMPGEALLDVLLDCGMRFGDMDIFHRHEQDNGDGPVLFSLANMVKPGTFDLGAMDTFTTPGVSLFLTLPIRSDSLEAFETMVDVAQTLAAELDAELKDENRSVMTAQTIEHCRQRVREYERKRLSRAHA